MRLFLANMKLDTNCSCHPVPQISTCTNIQIILFLLLILIIKIPPHIRPGEKSQTESISKAVNHENQSVLTTSAESGLMEQFPAFLESCQPNPLAVNTVLRASLTRENEQITWGGNKLELHHVMNGGVEGRNQPPFVLPNYLFCTNLLSKYSGKRSYPSTRYYSEIKVVAVRGRLVCLVLQKINHLQVLSFPQLDKISFVLQEFRWNNTAGDLQVLLPRLTKRLLSILWALTWPSRKQNFKGADGH